MFQQGIYEGRFVRDWLGERLGMLGVRTFADLPCHDPQRPPAPAHAYRLVVMTCDISQGCLRRLPDADGQDCWLMDGAMLPRFPIAAFDAPPGPEPRWPTFGIKLGAAPGPVSEVNDTVSMSRAMLNTMTVFYDRMHGEDAAAAARTIVIDTGIARATDFDLDRDTQELLFCEGREVALDFLDGAPGQPARDWAAYRQTYRSSQSPVMRAAMQARDALRSLRHRLHRRDQNGHRTPTGQAGPLKPSPTPL